MSEISTDHNNLSEMTNVIYGLIDPNTQELRYIGYASNLHKRLLQHYQPANLKKLTHKVNWLKSLLILGQKAEPVVLEACNTQEELPQAEMDMISYFKSIGCNLTNSTNGGDGGFGRIVSEESRKKVSISNTGKKPSQETIAKLSLANKGRISPNKGKKASDELRLKLSLAHIGKQGKKPIFSLDQEKMLVEEYNNTPITINKLASKYGVSRDTIFRVFRRQNETK